MSPQEQRTFKNAAEIKAVVDEGVHRVFWSNTGYEVTKDTRGQYFIKCLANRHCIGLTWLDGETLNGKPEEFFTLDEPQEN